MLRGPRDREDHFSQVVLHLVEGYAGFANLIAAFDLEVVNREIVVGDLLRHSKHGPDGGGDGTRDQGCHYQPRNEANHRQHYHQVLSIRFGRILFFQHLLLGFLLVGNELINRLRQLTRDRRGLIAENFKRLFRLSRPLQRNFLIQIANIGPVQPVYFTEQALALLGAQLLPNTVGGFLVFALSLLQAIEERLLVEQEVSTDPSTLFHARRFDGPGQLYLVRAIVYLIGKDVEL